MRPARTARPRASVSFKATSAVCSFISACQERATCVSHITGFRPYLLSTFTACPEMLEDRGPTETPPGSRHELGSRGS